MFDLILAVAHHILIFGIFGVLFAEFILVRPGMDQAMVNRVAATDLWYGVMQG
jgi:putative membrane protein